MCYNHFVKILLFYLIFGVYALLLFYFLRKKSTILSLQDLFYVNLVYCLVFCLVSYVYSSITISTIVASLFLVLLPLFYKKLSIIFNFSAPFFDNVVRENAKKLLIDYNVENEHTYVVKTKEAEMRVCLYPLFYKTAILSYKGIPAGKKIEVYKNLLKKSFYNVLPTITINLKK